MRVSSASLWNIMPPGSPTSSIAPPLATSPSSPARKCGPAFKSQHTRASCISFVAALGREEQTPRSRRPQSAHPGSCGTQRGVIPGSTLQWQFLTKTESEASTAPVPRPRPQSSRSLRPATARSSTENTAALLLPKRPTTCRPSRVHSAREKPVPSTTPKKPLVSVDPRVIKEAVRHEMEQGQYAGPLMGRSVELIQLNLLTTKPHRDSCVVNAVSLAEFHRVKAFQARAKGDQTRAIMHYKKLLEFEANDYVALFQLAVSYEKTGELETAHEMYRRVLPLDAENPFVYYNLGNLLMKMERVQEAINAYTTAIQKSGSGKCQNLTFYRQRGAAYRKHGDFEKAAQDYARVHAVRRRRSSLTNALPEDTTHSTSVKTTSSHDARATDAGVDLVDEKYSAEPIYTVGNFTSEIPSNPDDVGCSSVVDQLGHSRAMRVALRASHTRTEEELWLISDELENRFACCAALAPEARKELGRRVIGVTGLPRGAMLLEEGSNCGTHGGFIFFIARGRVSVYKKFAPRVAVSENQQDNADAENDRSGLTTLSWEMMRSAILDDPLHEDDEKEAVYNSLMEKFPLVNLDSWCIAHGQRQVLLNQLLPGDGCGRHGRFSPSNSDRIYTAVVAETCDLYAVSWADFADIEAMSRAANSEQMARFFRTVPILHGIPHDEVAALARCARTWKVLGQRVMCSEGQYVNGLILVREGTLCQLHPSGLTRPPNLSVSFSLSGSFAVSGQDPEYCGRHFFTQLEHNDDPLLFLHDSGIMHGYLSTTFLPQMLEKMIKRQVGTENVDDQVESASVSIEATNLPRGAFFCASSSWIPPRKSREAEALTTSDGVACAKSALISTESCDMVFLPSVDITSALSLASRARLQKNMQVIMNRRANGTQESIDRRPPKQQTKLSRMVFLKTPSGDDLVRQYVHDTEWRNYKHELVSAIVEDATRERRKRSQRDSIVVRIKPRTEWKL